MKIRKLRYWILAGDSLWIIGALGLAIYLHYVGTRGDIGFMQHFQTYSLMLSVAFVVWPLLYFEMSLDGFKGAWHIPAILSKIIVAVTLLLVGLRCLFRLLVASYPRNGCDNRCVILGNGPVAKELAVKFASHPELPVYV